MSKTTKNKFVRKELQLQEYSIPDDLNKIVKIKQNQGNYLHLIQTGITKEEYFISMPGKFRNNIWIKPGDYVIVKPIEEGNKVKGEIDQILDKKFINYLKQNQSWPFQEENKEEVVKSELINSDDEDLGLEENLNRRNVTNLLQETSSEEEDENED